MRDGFILHEKTMRQISMLDNIETAYLIDGLIKHYWRQPVDIDDVAKKSVAAAVVLIDAIDLMDEDERGNGRQTKEYKTFRACVLERDENTCQICGKSEGVMHVHHIKPFALYPLLATEVSNGITLCPECHREVHYGKE